MDSIKCNTNPFRNCPADILCTIFEAAVSRDESGFETAIIISHVSHYWRIVAFSTPVLWTCATFSMLRKFEDTMEFLEQISGRIGSRATCLVVKNIRWDQISTLGSFELKRIPNLKWLKLHVSEALPGTWPSLSEALNKLDINLTRLDLMFIPTIMDLGEDGRQSGMINSFPPNLRQLDIDGGGFMDIAFTESYPAIQHLSLRNGYLTFVSIVQRVSNLEVLDMDNLFMVDIHGIMTELEIPNLKRLVVHRLYSAGWLRSLSCPVLTELAIDEFSDIPAIIHFIKRHASITTLKVDYRIVTQELVDSAAQLQHLTITIHSIGDRFYSSRFGSQAQFPRLKTLTISDFEFQLLKEEFEELVMARCLPVHHPKSRLLEGCTPLDTLGIMLFKRNKLEDTNWAESELIGEATVWVEKDEAWDHVKLVCMSWSGRGLNTVS